MIRQSLFFDFLLEKVGYVDIPVILTPHSGDTDPSLVEVQRT